MNDRASGDSEDDRLAETVDMIGEVVGIMSGRIDDQSELLIDLRKSAVETRHAAAAARSNTNPARYAELISETVAGQLGQSFAEIRTVTHELKYHSELLQKRIEQETSDRRRADRDLHDRRMYIDQREASLSRKLILTAFVALFLGIVATRFALGTELGCSVLASGWNGVGSFCAIDPVSDLWNGG